MVAVAPLAGCSVLADPQDGDPAPTVALTPVRVQGLFAVQSVTLGAIVIDGRGYVLYRSDRDSAAPARSACAVGCSDTWLPEPYSADLQITGIDRQLVGQVRRADGTAQLTLAGWPLYSYMGDQMPGDTTGQGEDGTWWAVTPDGGKS